MNDPITITLTKERATELERLGDVIIDRMNRVDFLVDMAGQFSENGGHLSPTSWDGLSAVLKGLNESAAVELGFLESLKRQIEKEAAA